ncbi:S41 family peptidase [Tunicatimonas pelagia]|uniref:S41 family peptidase n=1 Tax=Tunicatimonas pelagia TaxID=931531 RepID=UPI0026656141|nr:S41 family peptidase [Tunicatimonas pelagia]WKN43470.1 S41 family peptidase [Tunicatimonas pelagia]
MTTKSYCTLFVIGLLFVSCEEAFLGSDVANNPEQNFELLWDDLDQHYSLFTVRNLNWDSIYQVYRPQVTAQTTNKELFRIMADMIEYLDDSHTWIRTTDWSLYHSSGYTENAKAHGEFSELLVRDFYLEYATYPDSNQALYYGKIMDKDIGYIYLADMKRGANGAVIDAILENIGHYQAIIFDIRNNGGGSTTLPQRIAGAFADERRLVFTHQTRNGPGHDDFEEAAQLYAEPLGSQNYSKPVIVLANRATISASEQFVLYMRASPNVTLLGDTTAGDFGYRSNYRFLPNGWIYAYSIGRVLLPDGSSLDGVGHIPDIYARNTPEGVYHEYKDGVLETAIEHLSQEYGIE